MKQYNASEDTILLTFVLLQYYFQFHVGTAAN